ncbi:ATP-dependent DNA helicase RRM3-like [Exaiptasia diaphana]|uniref:ATP-dependent DNA helicase n=1 Tax=Exaiptasia diaphana TaxID=2652724 RepID=A0A913YRB4_EXADI|nr:ATP-dependent DNA helicase RRM3-like [Exaiptasia diaphana]
MLVAVSLETVRLQIQAKCREVTFSRILSQIQKQEMLSSSQRKVENLVLDGYSVFISGEAGSGKSFFLRSTIKKLKEAFGFSRVAVAAPTGIAAVNVGGTTIHSFAGIGTGSKGAHELISRIQANPDVVTRWRNCSVLVIDEISMLSRELFEKLELIARSLNDNTKPFGGIQLIFSGDFYQLKPVVTDEGETSEEDIYCFASPLWNDCIDSSLFFSENYRQEEVELKLLLHDLRKSGRKSRKCSHCHKSGHRKTYKGKITCPVLAANQELP